MRILLIGLLALLISPLAFAQNIATYPSPLPALSGDCTNIGAIITCLKSGGAPFGTAAVQNVGTFLQTSNNLSDLGNATTARSNLGLGTAAIQNIGAFAQTANNLSDVTAATARTNLGLGTLATQAASSVAITGGAIDNATVGATTPATVKATTLSRSGVEVDTSYSYQTPSTGFSITPSAGVGRLILNPAGTLATGTVTMLALPVDGQLFVLQSSQIITALTLSANAGQSILGAPTTLALGGRIECIYRATGTTWYC